MNTDFLALVRAFQWLEQRDLGGVVFPRVPRPLGWAVCSERAGPFFSGGTGEFSLPAYTKGSVPRSKSGALTLGRSGET